MRDKITKFFLCLNLQIILSFSVYAMNDSWDPSLYRESSQMQKRWANGLLDIIDLDGARTILDIGSGDGSISLSMAQRYRQSIVIGLDISEKMVHFANENIGSNQNIFFLHGDAEQLLFDNQFNVVTSFSTMHRLQNPQLALQGIYRALKPGGMFVAAFPVKGNSIMSEAIAIVDSRPQWKDFFTSPDRKAYALSDKTYRQWLTDANFMVIKSRTKWEDETFKSREKFRDLLRATFSHRAFLPTEREIEFFDEVVDEYLKKFPLDERGHVHFYFNRIEIVAIKPEVKIWHAAKL